MATVVIDLPVWGFSLPISAPALVRRALGTEFDFDVLRFNDATDAFAYGRFRAVGYVSGSLTIRYRWYADTASSGDVIWSSSLACITPNTDTADIETKTMDTEQTVTDTHLGTTGQRLHECTLTLSNTDSIAADDECFLEVSRDANAAGDTLTGDVYLVSVQVEYTI